MTAWCKAVSPLAFFFSKSFGVAPRFALPFSSPFKETELFTTTFGVSAAEGTAAEVDFLGFFVRGSLRRTNDFEEDFEVGGVGARAGKTPTSTARAVFVVDEAAVDVEVPALHK